MVLDGEENETAGVLLQEGLLSLKLLDGKSLGGLGGLLSHLLGRRVGRLDGRGRVLLAGSLEVELLNGGVAHLEVLERGSSLLRHVG